MGRIVDKAKNLWYGLMYGLKITETEILTQKGAQSDESVSINQNVDAERMSRALLNGQETQAVQELRYRTYKVADEASKLEYITTGLVLPKQDSQHVHIDESEGYELILIQGNEEMGKGVLDEINRVNTYGEQTKYILQVERDFFPRFRIEEFTTKLVVKKIDDTHVQLDFYATIYPNEFKYLSKGFINEVNKIKDSGIKSDVIDLQGLKFITHKAHGVRDLMEYKFDNIFFKKIDIFDGNFVIKFKAHLKNEPVDLIARFYDKTMDEKYQNNEKKDVIFNLSEIDKKEYVCAECGKVITNEAHLKPNKGSDYEIIIGEDGIEHYKTDNEAGEFYDAQITLETYGKVLCKDCLDKLIKEKKV